jgi:2,3-bisphosphoglycerate-dependent phosphoglycerate mutase
MTTIYFIRHAQADNFVRDGRIRPLTEKGFADRRLVTEFLQDKTIDAVFSSPYKRAVDTIADFAEKNGFEIEIVEDFREQKSSKNMGRDNPVHYQFLEKQWTDFSYTLPGGESLYEVQKRNIDALNDILNRYKNKIIVIGTHGTALSTIINYYDNTYDFEDFMAMVNILPWAVKAEFDGIYCARMEKIELFNLGQKAEDGWWKVSLCDLGELKAYIYVVIFARYRDKWLYCRAKERETYETAGGHIETGETTLEAAKRELYEETGAVSYDITPAFDYLVRRPNVYANGQVFFAHIHELGAIPEDTNDKMAEVKLFDTIPEKMRFPEILPVLFEKIRSWCK